MSAVAVERVPLSFLLTQNASEDPPVEPVVPFAAFADERPVIVTALMERTAAFHAPGDRYDTGVFRILSIFVDPSSILWRTKVVKTKTPWVRNRHAEPHSQAARQAVRDQTDRDALADQAKKHREEETMKRISRERKAELAVEGLRHCGHCDQDKPVADFRSNGYCRSCGTEYDRARRQHNGNASQVLATSPGGDHYRTMAIEPIQYIEANNLPFHEANVVKYVSRWRLKNGLEDLRKAKFYIERLIELEEAHA